MWSPAVTAVRSQGVPCFYSDLKEGYRSWGIGFMVSKYVEGKRLDALYDFFDWYYSGPAGAFFARQGYYMPTPEQTRQHLPADEWDFWFEGKPAVNEVQDPFGNVMEKAGQHPRRRLLAEPHGPGRRLELDDGRERLRHPALERVSDRIAARVPAAIVNIIGLTAPVMAPDAPMTGAYAGPPGGGRRRRDRLSPAA